MNGNNKLEDLIKSSQQFEVRITNYYVRVKTGMLETIALVLIWYRNLRQIWWNKQCFIACYTHKTHRCHYGLIFPMHLSTCGHHKTAPGQNRYSQLSKQYRGNEQKISENYQTFLWTFYPIISTSTLIIIVVILEKRTPKTVVTPVKLELISSTATSW